MNDLHLTERESKALAVSKANLTKGVPVNKFNEVRGLLNLLTFSSFKMLKTLESYVYL